MPKYVVTAQKIDSESGEVLSSRQFEVEHASRKGAWEQAKEQIDPHSRWEFIYASGSSGRWVHESITTMKEGWIGTPI